MKKSDAKTCENCGEVYKVDKNKWCTETGVYCSDCYSGRRNGRTAKRFIEIVKATQELINNKLL